MDALFDAGLVILAGPFADGSGSLVILDAESVEAARAIFQNDPWAQKVFLLPPTSRNGRSFSTQATGRRK